MAAPNKVDIEELKMERLDLQDARYSHKPCD